MQKGTADTQSDDFRWNLLQRKAQEVNAAMAFVFFRAHGIEPVLIKGFAAHRNYPETHFRSSSDIDLAVAPEDFDAALELGRSFQSGKKMIDIHRGLRHLDTVDWDNLFANSITIDADGIPIRLLRPEDHLRVLCVHWLTDGGAFRERLWDIYYAIENRPADFDWNRCLDAVSPVRRRWFVCVIGLTHKYLDLNIAGLPFASEAQDLPGWLIPALEREWASDVRLTPIHIHLRDPANIMKQIRKRVPPNPIQATVDMEGSFDARTRVHYQFGSMIKRFGPSIRRVGTTLLGSRR